MPDSLVASPIGHVRSPYRELGTTPRQTRVGAGTRGQIELLEGNGFEFALEDLQPGQHLWVLFWFHLARGWKPKVRPPRSDAKRGVFSTRSPHRPNPIGLSVVRLVGVQGLVLDVEDLDMVDGTPVLDLKPYLAYADAIPDAAPGWLGAPEDPGPRYDVAFEPLATAQLEFLQARAIDLRMGIESVLSLGPAPHPYRRIKRAGAAFVLKHKDWRARFRVEGTAAIVEVLTSGYRAKDLASGGPELDVHREFVGRFG